MICFDITKIQEKQDSCFTLNTRKVEEDEKERKNS